MSALLDGCTAIARGAWEGGASFAAGYPGSPVTGVLDATAGYPEIRRQWAANEKIALETALGAAWSGARALVVMKHVGLNVAADPLYNAPYTGVRGALVIVVGDDPGASSSQNEQDTRLVAKAAGVPVLEPSSVAEALVFTRLAFEISARHDLPVIVRVTTPIAYGSTGAVAGARWPVPAAAGHARPIQKYLLLPAFVPARHTALIERLSALGASPAARWFCETSLPPEAVAGTRHPVGIVCAGFPAAAVRELCADTVPVLTLGLVHPLPEAPIRAFAQHCDRLLVVEESSHYLEDAIRALGLTVARRRHYDGVGSFGPKQLLSDEAPAVNALVQPLIDAAEQRRRHIPILAPRTPGFCAGCSHRGIFSLLAKRDLYVVGDIGCNTLGAIQPYGALHANLCMGASISVLQGYLAALGPEAARRTIAVLGDSTFFHSGLPAILSAVQNGLPGTVLVLDNAGSAMTGHQQTAHARDADGWRALLKALGVPDVRVVDALDLGELDAALDAALATEALSVVVLKGDCVQSLPRKGPTNYRYAVRTDACSGCGDCLKVDCPAIVQLAASAAGGPRKVAITHECIGCGLCSQTCPEHAIVPRTVQTVSPRLARLLAPLPWRRLIRGLRGVAPVRRLLDRFETETY